MVRMTKLFAFVLWVALMTAMAAAQTQSPKQLLSVEGYSEKTNVMRFQGRDFVDVQELARITNGSLSFNGDGLVLTFAGCGASERGNGEPVKAGFSRLFMKSAIEAMSAIREWGGILQATVQDRYPVGTPMTGSTIIAYQERAADGVALASASASTDSDYRGLELLRNEFSNLKAWTDRFSQARKSLTAQYMTLTDTPLQDDDEAQKIIHCGQFLAQMFPSGTFQDNAVCHKY